MKKNDILFCSWGYDQTNIDFYKVIDISKSGKTVTVVELEGKKEYTGTLQGVATPVDIVKKGAVPKRRKVHVSLEKHEYIYINDFLTAWVWFGEPMSFTEWA